MLKSISKSLVRGGMGRTLVALLLVTSLLVVAGLFPSPVLAATANVSLVAGQNLISLPLIPADATIATVLAGISGNVNSVWAYDANSGLWQSWSPTLGGDLEIMVDGYGYWVDMRAPATLTVTGLALPNPPAVPPTYSMVTGWNLTGFKATAAKPVGAYLTGNNYRFPIYGFANGEYTTISAITDNMQPGSGYWIYFNAEGIITP